MSRTQYLRRDELQDVTIRVAQQTVETMAPVGILDLVDLRPEGVGLHLLGHPLYPDPRPLVRELDMGDRIIFTGQIREQDKAPLYSGATAFLVSAAGALGLVILWPFWARAHRVPPRA